MATFRRIIQNIFHPFEVNNLNKVYSSRCYIPTTPIYVFYHIYAYNNWKEIVNEQIESIRNSGLYDACSAIKYSVICDSYGDLSYIKHILGDKGDLIYHGTNSSVYEFPALSELYKVCCEQDCYCMYIHTKGSSNSNKTLKWYYPGVVNLSELRANSRQWRRLMGKYNIDEWRTAVSILTDYDTYGCYYKRIGNVGYYAGNFWWSKSSYIKTLQSIDNLDWSYRYNAEIWLLNSNAKYYNACRLNTDLTKVRLPNELVYSLNKFKIFIGNIKLDILYIYIYIRTYLRIIYNKAH
jgi:hypothetical protein